MSHIQFLERTWYRWGQTLVTELVRLYNLDAEQERAMELVFLKPNDWRVEVAEPLGTAEPLCSAGTAGTPVALQ